MKLFLTGEGPTDCGKQSFSGEWEEGPVQVYIRKTVNQIKPELPVEIMAVDRKDIIKMRTTRRQTRTLRGLDADGYGRNAYFVAQAAADQNCDAVAMYVDCDKESGQKGTDVHSCEKRYNDCKNQVLNGLQQGTIEKTLAICPMKMIECWIL